MTDVAQRIAIAEACGWKRLATPGAWISPKGRFHYPPKETIPDYLNDLNAMYEAEKALLPFESDKWQSYVFWLAQLAPLGGRDHATAAQRAEAFIRTLNLWDDSK
jgi:hypothetical protein